MDFLPQVSPEDLDQGNLEGGDFPVHEDSCQIQLYLETHIDLKSQHKQTTINRGRGSRGYLYK